MGFWDFVAEVKQAKAGITSADRARNEKESNLRITALEQGIENNNARVTTDANSAYTETQTYLLQKQAELKKQMAFAKGDDTQLEMLTEDYNDVVGNLNKSLLTKKKKITKQYMTSGKYNFKPSADDNYETYLDNFDRDGEGEPIPEKEWINKRTIENIKEAGLLGYEDFSTVKMNKTEKDGVPSYALDFYGEDGTLRDTDNMGTVDDSLKVFGGENTAEQQGKVNQLTKNAELKQTVNFLKTNAEELGLDKKELARVIKASAGLDSSKNSYEQYKEFVDGLKINKNAKKNLLTRYAKNKAGISYATSQGTEYERLTNKLVNFAKIKETRELKPSEQLEQEYLQKRQIKLSETDRTSMKINSNFVKEYRTDLSEMLIKSHTDIAVAPDGEVDFATVDMSKLTPFEKTQVQTYADYSLQAQKTKGSETIIKNSIKTTETLSQLGDGISNVINAISNGSNINFVDKTYRQLVGSYIGLTENQLQKELENQEVSASFNTVRNALFGSAVSTKESKNFEDMAGNLYKTSSVLAGGMKTLTGMIISKLDAQRNALGNAHFNIKFGEQYQLAVKMRKALTDAIGGKGKKKPTPKKANDAYEKAQASKNDKRKPVIDYRDLNISK